MNSVAWRKNRNLYAMLLLDQVINLRLDKPFTSPVPDSGLPVLPERDVVRIISTIADRRCD